MGEAVTTEIAVGDQVRVHLHPAGAWKSFSEGVVRRVDVKTPAGHFFVLEVTHEVLLDREHRIRPGFLDYVQYECRNDFPGRIEILSATEQGETATSEPVAATGLKPVEHPDDFTQEPEAETEQFLVYHEPQEVSRRGGLIAALFVRQR